MKNGLCVALDVPTREQALELAETLSGVAGYLKVGLELFCANGPSIVTALKAYDVGIFLDLKFMDIPNTVAAAISQVATLGVDIINLHALGGLQMMRAAQQALSQAAPETKLLAVTILTSLGEPALNEELGIQGKVQDSVLHLAQFASQAGLHGVVASPKEITILRENLGKDFMILTPGIRPAWAATDDQKRFLSPKEAIARGADIIVVGRPITKDKDPKSAALRIVEEIS